MKSIKLRRAWVGMFCMLEILFVLAHADPIPCSVHFQKDSCWKDYQITLTAMNAMTHTPLADPLVLEPDVFSKISPLKCESAQPIAFIAKFTPAIWEEQAQKNYHSKAFWVAPDALPTDVSEWELSVCFPRDFVGTPLPLEATGSCVCESADEDA